MRYRLFIGLIVFTFFSCKDNFGDGSKRNENWVWWTDAKTGRSRWIPVGSGLAPVTNGKYIRFYFNGKVNEKGKLVNGKNVDTTFDYDINGHLQEYRIPKEGKSRDEDEVNQLEYFIHNGPIKIYLPNGRISATGIVINHRYGNKWVSYFDDGKIRYLRNSKGDTGWATRYYHNGKVKDSDYYAGEKVLLLYVKHWYENGQLASSAQIKDGDFNGIQKEYFENGQIKIIGNLLNGEQNGEITQWYESGKLKGRGNTKNGKWDGFQILYYENGQEQLEMTAKNGIASGEVKKYDEAGKLTDDYIMKNGVKIEDKLIVPHSH